MLIPVTMANLCQSWTLFIHGLNRGLKRWWSKACDNAFESVRRQLASQSVLVHCLATCDAFSYGLGVVVSHVMPDDSERSIAYAS